MNQWTDEEVELAIRLYREGVTRRVIAEQLNKSRNAVIGKLSRLGYAQKQNPKPELVGSVPFAPSPRHCQWPVGHPGDKDFYFCGEPSERGRPYCSTHCAVAYRRKEAAA